MLKWTHLNICLGSIGGALKPANLASTDEGEAIPRNLASKDDDDDDDPTVLASWSCGPEAFELKSKGCSVCDGDDRLETIADFSVSTFVLNKNRYIHF